MVSLLQVSPLLVAAAHELDTRDARSVRFVRSFRREPIEVHPGDGVLATISGQTFAGCVGEMMELFMPGRAVLRMMLSSARRVDFEDETRGNVITVRRDAEASDLLLRVESVALHEVHCDESDADVLTFNYIF